LKEETIDDSPLVKVEEDNKMKIKEEIIVKQEELGNNIKNQKREESSVKPIKQSKALIKENILKIQQLIESHKDVRRRKNIVDDNIKIKNEKINETSMKQEEKETSWILSKKKSFGRKSR